MTTKQLLEKGLQAFEHRSTNHTTGTLARDSGGNPIAATSPRAVCWCMNGMLMHLTGAGHLDDPRVFAATQLLTRACLQLGSLSTSGHNDSKGRAGAVNAYRVALLLHLQDLEDAQPVPVLALEGSTH